ncbi:urea transporter [Thalassomonas viridans]|uniref:Urea transporter n=1 Tax=Thalassomonas viridans TaxID=137584 RepID=A0AAE9Z9X7_9GAMM|nr:urea transporter [Thalassomonas viridans]WDE08784.1 urea transporter [Thalassomonas viridans]
MTSTQISFQTAIVILAGFSALWILWGWYLGKRSKSHDDFVLAGRNVGFALATATAMATWVTSNTTLVAPQLTFQFGVWGMLGYSMAALGLILFAPLASKIKQLLPSGYTSGDFIHTRYGRAAWAVFLIISLCYALGWLISLGMAGGILLSSLSPVSYHTGMTVIIFVCVVYTLLGGLRAVIATDFAQTIIIISGVAYIAYICINQTGFSTVYQGVQQYQPELLNLLFPAAIMFFFNNIFFGIGEIFHSNVWWSRAFAFKQGVGKKSFLVSGLLWFPIPIVTGFIALSAYSLGIFPESPDMVGPLVAANVLGASGAILVFIIIFSALASSMDSLLAATADLLSNDIYKKLLMKNASSQQTIVFNKAMIILLGVITWLICLPKLTTLGALLNFTGAFVASTIWPIIYGLYGNSLSGRGAAIAMLTGTITGLICYFQIGFYTAALSSCFISLLICQYFMRVKAIEFEWQNQAGN